MFDSFIVDHGVTPFRISIQVKMKPTPALLLLLTLTACNTATKPTPENYLKTINAWFPDHPDCLLDGTIRFPYETSDPAKTRQMDALVKAQVLEVSREPSIKVSRYTLTPEGVLAHPNLCYGHREATSIVSSTPVAMANGFPETQVTYAYKLEEKPMWATTPEVVAEFPVLAHEASGTATDKITLAQTKVNWSVPD